MSYIAEHYFGKSRQWLYQRINGNIVNGKPADFTPDELKTFQSPYLSLGSSLSVFPSQYYRMEDFKSDKK